MAAILISVGDIKIGKFACNNRGVHICAEVRSASYRVTVTFCIYYVFGVQNSLHTLLGWSLGFVAITDLAAELQR